MAIDEKLDKIIELLKQGDEGTQEIELASSTILSSTNTSQALNPNYYYDLKLVMTGGTSTDSDVYIQFKFKQNQQPLNIKMNSTLTSWRLKGFPLNQISINTSNIGSAKIYAVWVGYKNPQSLSVGA